MTEAIEWLKGKKTYLVLALGFLIKFLEAVEIAPEGSFSGALPWITMAGGTTLVAKFNRVTG